MPPRIHIASVHWPFGKWIDIQQKYLSNFISADFSCYTVVSEDLEEVTSGFVYAQTSHKKDHSGHLNHLQMKVLQVAESDQDILIFLDGDAFPIAPLDKFLAEKLDEFPLVAIQRNENSGEYLPHPGFTAARIKTWKDIGAVWGESDRIKEFGRDPGSGLQVRLDDMGIEWGGLLRTNKVDLHPLFFGIYENIIYHHGAGFREPISRIDISNYNLERKKNVLASRIAESLPNRYFLSLKRVISPYRRAEYRIIKKNLALQNDVFSKISTEQEFFQVFI